MKPVPFRAPDRRQATPEPPGHRLRRAGTIILLLGVLSAGLLYWLETRNPGPSLDDLMPGYSRSASRQMGIMYGQAGVLMFELRQQLDRPEVQAGLIVVVSGLIAAGCFRVAWLDDERAKEC